MNPIKKSALLGISFLLLSAQAQAKIVFICHKGLHYTHADVMQAYSGYMDEPRLADQKKLRPELLSMLKMDEAKYKKRWDRQFFRRALFQPAVKESDEAVVDFVAHSTEGLGYVSSAPHNSDVEVCGE